MTRYADPQRCPDCLASIAQGTPACPSCGLSLSGPLARELFETLTHADVVLTRLRPETTAAAQPVGRTAARAAPSQRPPAARGLSAASVPMILLALGAVCLLVAALVFLAVTWSVMGVGGRTATLVGLSGLAGSVAAVVARRGLRAAAESLSVVTLGLLAFDLAGARDSGWLGDLGDAGFLMLLGGTLTALSVWAATAVRRTPVRRLVGVEIVGVLSVATALTGFIDGDWLSRSGSMTAAVLAGAAATYAAHRLCLRVVAVGTGAVTGLAWALLVGTALSRALAHSTAQELWLGFEVWPILAAASLSGVVAVSRVFPVPVRVLSAAAAQLLLGAAALVPFSQGSLTELTLAVLVLMAVGSAVSLASRSPWAAGGMLALVPGACWLVTVNAVLLVAAAARLAGTSTQVWAGSLDGRLPDRVFADPAPWLLPLATLALVAVCVVSARGSRAVDRVLASAASLPLVVTGLIVSVAATVASYPVPVWVVVSVAALAAVAMTIWALRTRQVVVLLAGGGFAAGALVVSSYDDGLTALALTCTLLLAVLTLLRWPQPAVGSMAGAIGQAALTGSVWTWGELAQLERTWVGLGAVLLLGAAVLAVPVACARLRGVPGTGGLGPLRLLGVEAAALPCGLVAAVAAVAAAPYDLRPTWAAIYLTAGGVVACAVALSSSRTERLKVGWLGAVLLAAATWVRLWDTGIDIPEAYTLPSAAALTVVGVARLRRRRDASTMRALAPGLSLGLVPSLLWVVTDDPATLRAALLGLGALALLALGLRLRWTAPVVYGSGVGALVVLRHLAPAADAVPQWLLIASAGTALVAMGITWERRVQEAEAVIGYVRRLR